MAQQVGGYRPPDNQTDNQAAHTPAEEPQFRRVERVRSQPGSLTREQKLARIQRRRWQAAQKRRRRNRAVIGLLLILLLAAGLVAIRMFQGARAITGELELDALDLGQDELDDEAEEALYDGPPEATIAFVGDISTSADQVRAVTLADGTYDFLSPFEDVKDYFSQDRIAYAVGDFETTMVDDLGYGGDPYYNSPIQLAGALRTLGFRLMSTANTYALNNGIEGVVSTKNYLTVARIRSVGTYLSQEDRDKDGGAYIRNIHKIKFAFLSYTKGTDSVTMPEGCEYALNTLYTDYADYWSQLRTNQIRSDIQAARAAGAEVVVVLLHWGSELSRNVSEPQQELTQMLLENGVDVIIGTHSHMVNQMGFQKAELLDGTTKECYVAYGLGDFYTDPTDPRSNQSLILNLTFKRDSSGKVSITDATYVPIYQHVFEENGVRKFEVLDVYRNLAELKRIQKNADQAELFNALLDTIDTMHNYAGAEGDQGPTDADRRIVEKAILEGEVPALTISELRRAEQDAAARAAAAAQEEAAQAEAEAAWQAEQEEAARQAAQAEAEGQAPEDRNTAIEPGEQREAIEPGEQREAIDPGDTDVREAIDPGDMNEAIDPDFD